MTNIEPTDLTKYLEYPKSLTCIYGNPAAGKTTFCLLAALAEKGKVVFIDTENSFSIDRIKQINGSLPENLFLIKVNSFKEQSQLIENLLKLKGKIDLIIIDSFTYHYRKELQEKKDVNFKLSKQLSILAEISRESKIPIILTSQIYSTMDNNIEPVGGNMLKNWCQCLIKLEKNNERKIILEKHPQNKILNSIFEIVNKGIKF
ncbi:MAG: AAA family ATPase [Nanoarchaeota archaeon]|nr:AAA family ATPase [Nanoarchaeota archaeon]MBU4352368.1 AAA family ATPase [Nanoarchaeota archaeon]MBU4456749.1 AAA family ATPase [Nanoarchaeota archaeon]MCG2719336.1 AAA family ATPase [Nanoarchaeota archaeon]